MAKKKPICWAKLGASIIARKCGAEDYGLIDAAEALDLDASVMSNLTIKQKRKLIDAMN